MYVCAGTEPMKLCQGPLSENNSSSTIRRETVIFLHILKADLKQTQWRHLMAIIKFYKSLTVHFCASSHHWRDISIWNIWPRSSKSRWRTTTLAMTLLDQSIIKFIFWGAVVRSPLKSRVHIHTVSQRREGKYRLQIPKSIKAVSLFFALALITINKILTFQIFDLEKVGRGYELQCNDAIWCQI